MAERPKLGQLLLGAEVIAEGQLAAALDEQKQTGRPLGMTLVKMGFLDEETLVRTLARQLSLPIAWIRGKKIRKPVLELVPPQIVGAHRCLPVRVDDRDGSRTLLLAMEDPADLAVLDEVALAAGMPVRPVLAAPSEIEESIGRHFPDLEIAPGFGGSASAIGLDQELIPDIESESARETESDDKDDACMPSLERGADTPEPAEPQALADADDSLAGASLDLGEPDVPAALDVDAGDSGADLVLDGGDALGLEIGDPASLDLASDSAPSLSLDDPNDSLVFSGEDEAPPPNFGEAAPQGGDAAGAEDAGLDDALDLDADPDPSLEFDDAPVTEPVLDDEFEFPGELDPGTGETDAGVHPDPGASQGFDSDPAFDLQGPFDPNDPDDLEADPPPHDADPLAELTSQAVAEDPEGREPSLDVDTPEPELVHLSEASPLATAPERSQPRGALGSLGPDVILRALSQLLVEKGVIGRDELIARLTKLAGHDDGLSEDLEAEI